MPLQDSLGEQLSSQLRTNTSHDPIRRPRLPIPDPSLAVCRAIDPDVVVNLALATPGIEVKSQNQLPQFIIS
jgi:hypothetical protein